MPDKAPGCDESRPGDNAPRVLTALPLAFRLARWWSLHGPERGRWRSWELAARLAGRGRRFQAPLHYGATALVDLADPMSRYPIAYGGMPESSLYRAITRVLAPGDTFVDVGTNFGYYTLLAAGLVGPEGAVHSFEPQPGVADLLRRSAHLNDMPWISVHELALGDEAGSATMYLPRHAQSGLGTLRGDADWMSERDARTVQVTVATLDGVADEIGPGPVRALKIDAEGYELRVLRGGLGLLRVSRPIVFFESGGGADPDEGRVTDLLRVLGCEIHRLTADGPVPLAAGDELADQQNLCALLPEDHGPAGNLLASPEEARP